MVACSEERKDRAGRLPDMRDALPVSLAQALDWLDARPDESVKLKTLAVVAGVRPRTLEAQFRLYLGTTPLGWVRRTRLQRARQQLLSASDEASVTCVALANGFDQLGRFAGRYRRQFGELPSETLKAARANSSRGADDVVDEVSRLSWRALERAF